MPENDYSVFSEEWQGFKISKLVRIDIDGGARKLVISLEPDGPARCGACGAEVSQIHDSYHRRASELPCFECEVELDVSVRRVNCPFCGRQFGSVQNFSHFQLERKPLTKSMFSVCPLMQQVAEGKWKTWECHIPKCTQNFARHRQFTSSAFLDAVEAGGEALATAWMAKAAPWTTPRWNGFGGQSNTRRSTWRIAEDKKKRIIIAEDPFWKIIPAPSYSPTLRCAVPSPQGPLTIVFGMGTSVATPP